VGKRSATPRSAPVVPIESESEMTDPSVPPDGKQIVGAQTLPFQGLVNRIVRGLLRTPILSRVVGRRLVTIYLVGRISARQYRVPVAYTRLDGGLLVASQFTWVRNLRTGEPVDIRLAGKRLLASVRVLTDEAGVVSHLALMARDNHQFAKFNRIRLDPRGEPVPGDLHQAWAAGTRVALLTPR
jgi:hypothetical protein